jgi:predicted RND superfamily exporter protein
MTTQYRRERLRGVDKKQAIADTVQTNTKSVMVSALSFFGATFGVGLYSNIDMISSLCTLMARGALISMVCVIFVLPSFLMVTDKVIMVTSLGGRKKTGKTILRHRIKQIYGKE